MTSAAPIAFVRDWLTVYAGADRVMEAVLELYPHAPIYTLLYQRENFRDKPIARHPVHVSFIDRLPGGRSHHRLYFPLMPLAIEQLDLGAHETVVSLSHSVAHGVLTRADQLHITYFYTPPRYAWDLRVQYLRDNWLGRGPWRFPARLLLHYFRMWDFAGARRPDVVVASSHYVARRVWKHYRREAEVIYPPVEVQRFRADRPREQFFVTVGRLVPYKKIDLIVEAFSRLGRPLRVIGDGPERRRLERLAGPTVELMGFQSDAVVQDQLERCAAFVFAADEDFGIAPVEAQAAGAPVIAYRRGGTSETVTPGESGVLFSDQSVESLMEAVATFDAERRRFDPERIRRGAMRFSRERFQHEFQGLIEREWTRFRGTERTDVMELTETKDGGVTVLAPSGRLDASSAAEVEAKVLGLIDGGADRLVIDCAGLDYISSAGLRILLMAAKRLAPPRGKLALAALKPQVRDVLEIAGFTNLFAIHANRAAAIAGVR